MTETDEVLEPAEYNSMFGVYVRHRLGANRVGRTFPPMLGDHALAEAPCIACMNPLAQPEEPIVLLTIGPGADPDTRDRHWAGRWYNAVAIPLHKACLGEEAAASPEEA